MDCHFIESCEDEREVLRKIRELKQRGFSEEDMYVIARSNEQVTGIRTRTEVDYHIAEGRGMGRIGIFFKGGPLPPYFSEMADETRASALMYQQLLEGKILFFYSKTNNDEPPDWIRSSDDDEARKLETSSLLQQYRQWNEEERVFIDSMHYDSFHPSQAEPIQNRPDPKRQKKRKKWPGAEK